jgi:dihydrofolate reductase
MTLPLSEEDRVMGRDAFVGIPGEWVVKYPDGEVIVMKHREFTKSFVEG